MEKPKFSFEETSDEEEEELEGMVLFSRYIIIPTSYSYSLHIAMNLI